MRVQRITLLTASLLVFASAGVASAATGKVGWKVDVVSLPSAVSASDQVACATEEKCDVYQLVVLNAGSAASDPASPVTVTDTLPAGLEVTRAHGGWIKANHEGEKWACEWSEGPPNAVVTCTFSGEAIAAGHYAPFITIEVSNPTAATQSRSEEQEAKGQGPLVLTNRVEVAGGGAESPAVAVEHTPVTNQKPVFGPSEEFGFEPGDETGAPTTTAGGHPWELTTNLGVPAILAPQGSNDGHLGAPESRYQPVENIKRVSVELPLGFMGDPQALGSPKQAQCTQAELRLQTEEEVIEGLSGVEDCPPGSRIGLVAVTGGIFPVGSFEFTEREFKGNASAVFNMVPEKGYPAEFGFTYAEQPVYLYVSIVHTPQGYRTRVDVPGIPSALETEDSSLTIFGEPGLLNGSGSTAAFLGNPSNCTSKPLNARIEVESWNDPGHPASRETAAYPPLSGCNLLLLGTAPGASLAFQPSGAGEGGTSQADTPSAFTAELKIPQASQFSELATPPLKTATVTLPAGLSINPAAAQGLVGCQTEGPEGINIGSSDIGPGDQDLGDPEATELGAGHAGGDGSPYDDGLYHEAHGHCPAASTVGTVEVVTPVLATPLHGHVYAAAPKCGGTGQPACTEASATNGELFGAYLEVEGSGVIVKLPGKLSANPQTGQLTATFSESPQFPFSSVKLQLHGGSRAVFANPQTCGRATTSSALEPWGAPAAPNVLTSSAYTVTGCGEAMPFAPSFQAGGANAMAGAASPFSELFSRQDGEQDFYELTETLPPGLLAKAADVPLCGEAQANSGACGAESQIGTATVSAGAGPEPLYEVGKIFLTEHYKNEPLGIAVVVPAVAGPFNLGNVVVRGAIEINSSTAQVTIKSDPFPTIIDGVPLRVRSVNVAVNREGFTLNPTNCAQQQVTATMVAEQGATSHLASPYTVKGCNALPFKPTLSASVKGHTSRVDGVAFAVKVEQRAGEADIHKVDLQLPHTLPAQLKTLRKACTAAQFEANPAGCPTASAIGIATADTPLLRVPLTGPAYLVSHGNTAYPDVEFVLQGDERGGDVKIVLDGGTDIKNGVLYSNFESVPDAPISSFEATFPEGPNAVLTANGADLCTAKSKKTMIVSKRVAVRVHGRVKHLVKRVKRTVMVNQQLTMPTTIVGQNGMTITQNTVVSTTGCSAHQEASKQKSGKKPRKRASKH